ncbi:MAG: hypothetical protein IJU23_03335 [Proteobacteria bacterium]|nr:hypothetical protein [Pseudomonadota bacterium]
MKNRAGSRILVFAFLSLLTVLPCTAYAQDDAYGNESEAVRAPAALPTGGNQFANASNPIADIGGWYWGLLDDPVLIAGTTAVASDVTTPATIYVGGPGYIAVSPNSGAEWTKVLDIEERVITTSSPNEENVDDDGNVITMTNDQKVALLRDYISQNLEDDEYDTTEIEALQDEITDDELLDASSIDDIPVLKDLNLSMERDLSHLFEGGNNNELSVSVSLSDFDSFIMRYRAMTNSGAEEDVGIAMAARAPVVWQFVPTSAQTYAVTSGAIYMTSDQGNTWQPFLPAPDNTAILSYLVGKDGTPIAIGMSNGMIYSPDGGRNWIQMNEIVEGAVFDIQKAGNTVWALTTETLYYTNDNGMTWDEASLPLADGEFMTSVIPGNRDNALVLTSASLYYSDDLQNWVEVPCAPFAEETIRQVIASDEWLSTFTVRTDAHVFQLTPNGWIAQNNLLFANDLGNLTTFNDSYSLAAAASPSGLWLAQSSPQLAVSEEYRTLFKIWESEPNDYEVIQRALEAHFLDDMVDKKWGMRSRLSWLLPTFTFDYYFRKQNIDKYKIDVTFSQALPQEAITQAETYTFTRERQKYWQVMARWNIEIGRGLKDEVAGARQEANLRARRNSVIKEVRTHLNKRHASQTTLILSLPKLPETRKSTVNKYVKTTLALQEAEAKLHYLTGGYYIPAVRNSETHK